MEIVSLGDTQVKERRASKRITFSLPVHLELDRENNSREFETADISERGVFIPTDSPLPVSTKVTLVIPLSALETNSQTTGTVVRSNSKPIEGGEPAGMAIEFTECGELGWRLLRRFMEAQAAASNA